MPACGRKRVERYIREKNSVEESGGRSREERC
jgi:hypothetical protein